MLACDLGHQVEKRCSWSVFVTFDPTLEHFIWQNLHSSGTLVHNRTHYWIMMKDILSQEMMAHWTFVHINTSCLYLLFAMCFTLSLFFYSFPNCVSLRNKFVSDLSVKSGLWPTYRKLEFLCLEDDIFCKGFVGLVYHILYTFLIPALYSSYSLKKIYLFIAIFIVFLAH